MTAQTILLVEDDPDEEQLALFAFQQSGFQDQVVVARDGQEAVDYMLAQGAHCNRDISDIPRVVFLDINLPKLNGFEVLKAIRGNATTSLVPIVLLTTSDQACDRIEGYRHGANSFVRKPDDLDKFVASIHELGNYWLELNTPAYD
jgi:two-component system, response regulator